MVVPSRYLTLVLLGLVTCLAPSTHGAPAPDRYTEPITGMQFVAIPGGSFTMGDLSGKDPYATPTHTVTVPPFYLGKYEVTFAEYDLFARATGRPLPSDAGWGRGKRPAINVGWHDAVAFTAWLSQQSGRTFRLPSEAEWEFAARGGKQTRFYWGEVVGRSNANCKGCGSPWDARRTAAVGAFTANPYGLHDMLGNVYEWCLDSAYRNYVDAPVDGSPWLNPADRDLKIQRGGAWNQPVAEVTVARRCWDKAESSRNQNGFRVLLEP